MGHLSGIYVDPRFQRQGIATALVGFALDRFRKSVVAPDTPRSNNSSRTSIPFFSAYSLHRFTASCVSVDTQNSRDLKRPKNLVALLRSESVSVALPCAR